MPTKYINEDVWKQIKEIAISTILDSKVMVKETEVLHVVLSKGLQHISSDDIANLIEQCKKK